MGRANQQAGTYTFPNDRSFARSRFFKAISREPALQPARRDLIATCLYDYDSADEMDGLPEEIVMADETSRCRRLLESMRYWDSLPFVPAFIRSNRHRVLFDAFVVSADDCRVKTWLEWRRCHAMFLGSSLIRHPFFVLDPQPYSPWGERPDNWDGSISDVSFLFDGDVKRMGEAPSDWYDFPVSGEIIRTVRARDLLWRIDIAARLNRWGRRWNLLPAETVSCEETDAGTADDSCDLPGIRDFYTLTYVPVLWETVKRLAQRGCEGRPADVEFACPSPYPGGAVDMQLPRVYAEPYSLRVARGYRAGENGRFDDSQPSIDSSEVLTADQVLDLTTRTYGSLGRSALNRALRETKYRPFADQNLERRPTWWAAAKDDSAILPKFRMLALAQLLHWSDCRPV